MTLPLVRLHGSEDEKAGVLSGLAAAGATVSANQISFDLPSGDSISVRLATEDDENPVFAIFALSSPPATMQTALDECLPLWRPIAEQLPLCDEVNCCIVLQCDETYDHYADVSPALAEFVEETLPLREVVFADYERTLELLMMHPWGTQRPPLMSEGAFIGALEALEGDSDVDAFASLLSATSQLRTDLSTLPLAERAERAGDLMLLLEKALL